MENKRYSAIAMLLHWVIAGAVFYQIWLGASMPHGDEVKTIADFEMIQLHKSVGITILLLSLLRLGWRLMNKPPALPASMAGWERVAARISHVGFYVLMIGTPLAGWATVSSSPLGVGTVLYDIVPWPHLPVLPNLENKAEVSEAFAGVHELLVSLLILLLALHIGAVLKHMFISRDGVLARMLPFLPMRR